MADKKVTLKFKSDIKDAEKGLNQLTSSFNAFAKKIANSPITKLSTSFVNISKALGIVGKAFSSAKAAIDDVTNAYNVQAQAEKKLEAAAKNNPYLSDHSVDQLKKYAGELQAISTVGDEELLPMMAQLAAAGRTQNEIQDIMAASLDISASGAMSLETAVKQLNATYSGTAGQLGKMNGAIKGLSAEQLRNGDAVRIMREQYSGIAKTVTESTGGWQQFKNTLGDIKESMGSTFANLQNKAGKVLNKFFGTIAEKLKSAGKDADEFKKKMFFDEQIKKDALSVTEAQQNVDFYKKELEQAESIQTAVQKGVEGFSKSQKEAWKTAENDYNQELKKLEEIQREAEITRQTLESNRSNELLSVSGAEEAERVYKKYSDSLVDAGEAYNLAKANADKYRESEKKNVDELKKKYDESATEYLKLIDIFNTKWHMSEDKLREYVENTTEKLTKAQADLADAQKEAANGTVSEADQKALDIIKKNTAELNKNIDAINRKYALMEAEGQKIDELAKAQEILSAKESAYLSLISKDTSAVTSNNSVAKARLADIRAGYEAVLDAVEKKAAAEKDAEALESLKKEAELLTFETQKFVVAFDEVKLSARIERTITMLEAMKETLGGNVEEAEKLQQKIDSLAGLLDEVRKKENEAGNGDQSEIEKWAQTYEQKLQIVSDFAGKYADIMKGISDLATESAKNEASVKQAELEKQLAAGLISQEEYAEKKEQIDRESAEKQYRMQMWAWAANLVNIQAQTALAIVSTLAQETGPAALKIAMSSLIGAMGAIQLATAISNKPVPPSFATGGVVGGFQGASLGGDNTYIHARQGEMILNAAQQKAMWDTLNGAGHGGMQMNVTVRNTASNIVTATPQLTRQGLEVYIKQTVRRQMEDGEYDSAMLAASLNETGIRYTN